jgi:hypothetical protein
MHLTYRHCDREKLDKPSDFSGEITEKMISAALSVLEEAYCGEGVYAITEEAIVKIYREMQRAAT